MPAGIVHEDYRVRASQSVYLPQPVYHCTAIKFAVDIMGGLHPTLLGNAKDELQYLDVEVRFMDIKVGSHRRPLVTLDDWRGELNLIHKYDAPPSLVRLVEGLCNLPLPLSRLFNRNISWSLLELYLLLANLSLLEKFAQLLVSQVCFVTFLV